jgi:membrane-associated phospholipid phosphatase
MRVLTKLFSCFMILALLAGCTFTVDPNFQSQASSDQVQPDAGTWQTWVLPSADALRPAAPPDAAATQAELAEVEQLVAGRDEVALQQVAYWDAGSPSYRWIEAAFAQNRSTPAGAPRVLRMMSMMNVAIYDGMVAAWDAKYTYNRARPGEMDSSLSVLAQHTNSPSYPSEHAVAAGAASTVLAYIYPDQAQTFLDMAQEAANSRVLAGASFPSDVQAGLELGQQVAEQVIARAAADDALPAWDGVIPTGDGYWTGENPGLPTAGQYKTWVLASGDELRAAPPPAYGSPELAAAHEEVVAFTRTVQSTYRAVYWQSPQGAFEGWYNLVATRLFEQGLHGNAPEAARIYALMSVAHHDACVACWNNKFTYWYFRPFQMDETLTTVFPTPNYPSYPSGHACVSTAISEVTAALFPDSAETLRGLATEALASRMWAGIHWGFEMEAGKEIGLAVAEQVLARADEMAQQ